VELPSLDEIIHTYAGERLPRDALRAVFEERDKSSSVPDEIFGELMRGMSAEEIGSTDYVMMAVELGVAFGAWRLLLSLKRHALAEGNAGRCPEQNNGASWAPGPRPRRSTALTRTRT
jgi:hypothetical protein